MNLYQCFSLISLLSYCTTINAQQDYENILTEKQLEIIYENTKVFPAQTQIPIAFH